MILWLRHGQSTWNVLDRMQGHTAHPPLTDLGREQAAAAAELLADRGVTRILSSPAVRAQQTADIVAARLGLEVETDDLLVEKGLDEEIPGVLARIRAFLDAHDDDEIVLAVSHGDTIGLAVGILSRTPPALPANGSVTHVDMDTGDVVALMP